MKLLVQTLLLLSVFGSLTIGEVVKDFFATCGMFFAPPPPPPSPPTGRRPTVLPGAQYRQICQKLGNQYYYATLYDTTNKIPVYSAYRFWGIGGCDRKTFWYIEPQLDNTNLPDMSSEGQVLNHGVHQAVNKYYEGTGFHRGHLAPVYQQKQQACADATFTLTNAAPQNASFNSGQWQQTEKKVAKTLGDDCVNKGFSAFIVTGVVPGNNLKNTVNIPSHFWTAYCCVNNNYVTEFSGSYLGLNQNDKIPLKTTAELDKALSHLYRLDFKVFGGQC